MRLLLLPTSHGNLELLLIDAHVQDVSGLLLLSEGIRLAPVVLVGCCSVTHRGLLVGEDATSRRSFLGVRVRWCA